MQDLQLVGVHEDGEHVLLRGADGQRYRLAIDEPLRAAARRDRARLGQLQIEIQGHLRPKDIQARIRAGESADDIAVASGLAVEHVRRFEGPVLAEREHVAYRAQRQVVRSPGPGRGPELATLVSERLSARGVDGGAWDAWRREDGNWMVQLAFRTGSKDRRARWSYDLVSGALEPVDDEARWLCATTTGDDGPVPARRLSAVKERVYDVEADGGVRESQTSTAAHEHEPVREQPVDTPADTSALLEELRERRGRRQPVATPEEMAEEDDAQPPAAHPPASRPAEATDAEILALPDLAEASEAGPSTEAVSTRDDDPPVGDAPARDASSDHAPADDGARTATKTARRPTGTTSNGRSKTKAKARRPSVPSWDEIVFGAKKE